MRGIWQQTSRPNLSFTTARTTVKSTFGRRSATRHGTRSNKVAACDVFAAFLAPLLAAAAFADTSWKNSKRKEWEIRFKEISDEVERLKAREVEVWTRIQHRSIRRGAISQRRMYSTAAHAISWDKIDAEDWAEAFEEDAERTATQQAQDNQAPAANPATAPLVMRQSRAKVLEYESLVRKRLILRLLLYVYSDHDPKYEDKYHVQIQKNVLPEEIGRVVIDLQAITQQLRTMAHYALRDRPGHFLEAEIELGSPVFSRQHDRQQLRNLAEDYRAGKLDTRVLIDCLVEWLLDSDRPPGPYAFVQLILVFTHCGLDQPADYAVSALRTSGYTIRQTEIVAILEMCSNLRDLKTFDWLIQQLTSKDGFLRNGRYLWNWIRVDGTLIAAPALFSPFLYRGLIRSTINFGQMDRAAAYYKMTQKYSWAASHESYVLKAFLQYHAINRDWDKGKGCIGRALRHLTDDTLIHNHATPERATRQIAVICLRIADLFAACDKQQMLTAWITLVAREGIPAPDLDASKRSRSASLRSIAGQWTGAAETLGNPPAPLTADGFGGFRKAVQSFADSFGLAMQEIDDTAASMDQSVSSQRTRQDQEQTGASMEVSTPYSSPHVPIQGPINEPTQPLEAPPNQHFTNSELVNETRRSVGVSHVQPPAPVPPTIPPDFFEAMEMVRDERASLESARRAQQQQLQSALDQINALKAETIALHKRLDSSRDSQPQEVQMPSVLHSLPSAEAETQVQSEPLEKTPPMRTLDNGTTEEGYHFVDSSNRGLLGTSGGSGHVLPESPMAEGDWRCGCQHHNYHSNKNCRLCGEPRANAVFVARSAILRPSTAGTPARHSNSAKMNSGVQAISGSQSRHWHLLSDATSSTDDKTVAPQATELAPESVPRPHSAELSFPSEHMLPPQQEDNPEAEDSGYDSLPESPASSLFDAPPSPSPHPIPVTMYRSLDVDSFLDNSERPIIRRTNNMLPRASLRDKGLEHKSFTPVDDDDPAMRILPRQAKQKMTGSGTEKQISDRIKLLTEAKKRGRAANAEARRAYLEEQAALSA
ncbi:uncharacterized protein AB675_11000 [Cyphellophora attinorum]|uniref:RanBP2-type domain-containing protein n=1 Tax=Cyphellophora attinorum TaxID=1664694 RepID=A0A0N1NVR9_9EURO|nr:uncharacterized protein AB675_11000 [Phialophora attinorum]KPI35523.1 hypothetical protein AB675_11000 [Phialophora attinorum]